MKRLLLFFLLVLQSPAITARAVDAVRSKPNIVFIMADDLGDTDVACFGSKFYETPNIDRLASQGMKLLSHHHCQNCTPTRAALMSGQYGARTGVYTVGGTERFDWSQRPLRPVENVTDLPLDRDIFARQLKASGYATGMFGKWHIGQQGDYLPGKRGFDEAIVSMGKHFQNPDATLHRDAIFQHFPGYLGAGADSWRTTPVSLIQVGDWKLMEFLEDGRQELYNLSNDIGETKNLSKEMPEKAKELYARLVAWRTEVNAPMPTKNEAHTPKPKFKAKGKKKAASIE